MNKMPYLSALVLVFVLGWAINSLYSTYSAEEEVPFTLFAFLNPHKAAPYNRIDDSQILIDNEGLTVVQDRLTLANYAPTGSMLPFITEGHTGIEIPASDTEIYVGDIVAYRPSFSPNTLVVHQVVEIREINGENCYIRKGFNNIVSDGCIKKDQVEYVLVGVLF